MAILSRKAQILLSSLALGLASFGAQAPVHAQAMAGRAIPGRPTLGISYYKIKAGKQDEWLALYIKWHKPIMDYMVKIGRQTSVTVYANTSHALAPQWDFMVVYNTPPNPPAAGKTFGEIIRDVHPDLDAYTAGEKERWALTEAHWDQSQVEVDLTVEHPGVYYPILSKAK